MSNTHKFNVQNSEHINIKLAKTQGKLGRCGRMKCFHGSNNAIRKTKINVKYNNERIMSFHYIHLAEQPHTQTTTKTV